MNVRIMEERSCKVCGKLFVPKAFNGLFCSEECKKENKRQYKKTYIRTQKIEKCAICGKEFIGISPTQITCSAECSRIRSRDLYKNFREKPKKEVKKDNSIASIQKKARESGLTYGQYVLKMGLK